MSSSVNLSCTRCGTTLDGLNCAACGARYETVYGIPFIGEFEAEDALGLLEIVANAPNRKAMVIDPAFVSELDATCAAYHAASDKDAFVRESPLARAPWFLNRYNEWSTIHALLEGVDLKGAQVLDIGAGAGFDAYRLALRGARVTALEYSPILLEAGRESFPEINWVGGFSHALPFPDQSFDFVFINAALHHMRDIPASMSEALRVLKPGGTMITSADSFRPATAPASLEFSVFDKHEAVLLGINEQIPPVSDFLKVLIENRRCLDPEIYTDLLYGGLTGRDPDLTTLTRWDLDHDAEQLMQRSGNIATKVKLLTAWPHPARLQGAGILSPANFAEWLDRPAFAYAELAKIMPARYVDTPFPDEPKKFDLLNGWRVLHSTGDSRTAYMRGRLFLSRSQKELKFFIRSPVSGRINVRLNSEVSGSCEARANVWEAVDVKLMSIPQGARFVLEFERASKPNDNFEDGCFEVRRSLPFWTQLKRRFAPSHTPAN